MSKIRMLSEGIIGKIAAGEVVERPVSAIKELIENSLDAGATAITAEIREGGLSYIRVTDNGSGIDESDIRMAFERHATSKISREPDLYAISTLGFRGEALASIAAVSHITMTTRTSREDIGIRVKNEGGKLISVEETAAPVGTTMIVTDLFYNTPVRKGFMKKPAAEGSAISDLMMQMILSRPDISFRFINNGKTMFHSPGDGQLSSAIHTIYGGQVLQSMRKVTGHMNGLIINGYVGIGDNARGNRGQEMFFINSRIMHSSVLSGALEQACRERVMIGKFPICALHIQIAYETVDVNVHPNKYEVRFKDENAVREAVFTLVYEALKDRDAFEKPVPFDLSPVQKDERRKGPEKKENAVIPQTNQIPERPVVITTVDAVPAAAVPSGAARPEPVFREIAKPPESYTEVKQPTSSGSGSMQFSGAIPEKNQPEYEKAEQISTILPEVQKPLRIFGALFNTYILIEYEEHLLLIDQHAVHERLLFDRLMKEHTQSALGQELLLPLIVPLTRKELSLIEENRDALESIGLIIESFGETDAAVRTVPVVLGKTETVGFIRDVIHDLENGRGLTFEKKRSDLLQTACKHAVKGGEPLSEDQLRSLVEEMLKKKVTPTCPHGRPLVVSISRRER